MDYYIYLTNDCNSNCKYCSVLFDCEKYHIPITPNYKNCDIVNFIRRTQTDLRVEDVTIFFFGGEPTLEYDRMKEMIGYFRENLANYILKFAMYTNGLLAGEMPEEISREMSLIKFSINYENIPPFGLKDSYFSKVMDNAIRIKKRNVQTMGRLTITEKTSLYTDVLMAQPFFEMIYWQLENCTGWENYQAFYDTYTYEVKLLFDYWLGYLEKGILLQFIPFMSIVKFMFYHDRSNDQFGCGYGTNQIYIQTDGHCYACCDSVAEGVHRVGDIYEGVVFPDCSLSRFCCHDCHFRPVCLGRCGRMHQEFTSERIEEYCRLNKFVFGLFEENAEYLKELFDRYPTCQSLLSNWFMDTTELTA